jgi:deubiquitinase DESI2
MQGVKVFINLYDLSPANDCLYTVGMGFHHSGVEVLGTEYSFASNAGIFESSPKEAPGAKFREQIFMGVLEGGQMELKKAIDDLRVDFGPNDYNIVRKNCNHFANHLVYKLVGKPAPAYINRMADLGACCACLLPKQFLENAPVGDETTNGADGSGSSFGGAGSGIYARGPSAPQSNTMRAFTGTGYSLSGDSASTTESQGLIGSLLGKSSGGGSAKGTDDLTDRREKARKAALARLEKQQNQSVSSEQKDK